MRRVLLVADLEGVAGVDLLESLVIGSPGYPAAQDLLTSEVVAAIEGFFAAGFTHVRVSDSHRAGSPTPNVLAERLPPGVELVYRDDAYAADLFDDVDAVACLGMHAAADTTGFAAHTITFHCALLIGDRKLSETDLVLGLAAQRGIPVVFVSGDDVLAASLDVPCFVTKTSSSPERAESISPAAAREALRAAARQPPVPAPPLPDAPWRLSFKSHWQTRLAGDPLATGSTTAERYACALTRLARTEAPFARAIRTFEPAAMREDVVTTLRRSFVREAPPRVRDPAARALASFLDATDGDAEWQLADRALTLHLLQGHAPDFFAAAGLAPRLARAVARLVEVPATLPDELDPFEAMWRMDAVYVRAHHGAEARLDRLIPYVRGMAPRHPLAAWLIWEMGTQLGLCPPSNVPPRPLRAHSRLEDLYWLTHLFLLATRYGALPFEPRGWEAETEELLLAVPWILAEQRLDLGGEIALCLQLAGEADSREHGALLRALVAAQRPDGMVIDPSPSPAHPERDSHSTAVALLAMARFA